MSIDSIKSSGGLVIAVGGVVCVAALVLMGLRTEPEAVVGERATEPVLAAESPRIAALLPYAADQLIAMGVTPVAVPALRGPTPAAWEGIPTVMVDHSAGPNLEQLLAAEPEVVITSSVYAQFMPMIEESTGAEIVVMDVDSVGDALENFKMLGTVANATAAADSVRSSIEDSVTRAVGADDPIRVLAMFGTPHAFYAFVGDSYLGDLVTSAGGSMITEELESHSVYRGLAALSMEIVLERDPELLLVVFHGSEEPARAMLDADPLWANLSAVKAGSVRFLNDDLYTMRQGSELEKAVDEVQGILEDARKRLR